MRAFDLLAARYADPVQRITISVVFCLVISLWLMPSQAAEGDGVLQCDFFIQNAAVFTPDGHWLVGAGYKKTNKREGVGTLCVWNVESEKLVVPQSERQAVVEITNSEAPGGPTADISRQAESQTERGSSRVGGGQI